MPTELIEGHVDELGRPLVRIRVAGLADSVLGLVDTGFNGTILIPRSQANAAGFYIFDPKIWVQVAIGSNQRTLMCDGTIEWFDRTIDVTMLVEIDDPHQQIVDGEPIILIGTELLANSTLNIDFAASKIVIRPSNTE